MGIWVLSKSYVSALVKHRVLSQDTCRSIDPSMQRGEARANLEAEMRVRDTVQSIGQPIRQRIETFVCASKNWEVSKIIQFQ